jgi:hypothetical protein
MPSAPVLWPVNGHGRCNKISTVPYQYYRVSMSLLRRADRGPVDYNEPCEARAESQGGLAPALFIFMIAKTARRQPENTPVPPALWIGSVKLALFRTHPRTAWLASKLGSFLHIRLPGLCVPIRDRTTPQAGFGFVSIDPSPLLPVVKRQNWVCFVISPKAPS